MHKSAILRLEACVPQLLATISPIATLWHNEHLTLANGFSNYKNLLDGSLGIYNFLNALGRVSIINSLERATSYLSVTAGAGKTVMRYASICCSTQRVVH